MSKLDENLADLRGAITEAQFMEHRVDCERCAVLLQVIRKMMEIIIEHVVEEEKELLP